MRALKVRRSKRRFLVQSAAFLGALCIGGLFTSSQNVRSVAESSLAVPLEDGFTSLSVEHHFGVGEEHFTSAGQRHLLSGGGCECPAIADKEWAKKGVAAFVFIVLYVFLGLAVVCDEFFVASLEIISEQLHLSEDVAGATFMAMGSSAPELFTSMMALAQPDSSDSMGSGTIVGSAVFNVLVIIGATGIVGHGLILDWKPLLRDGLFYGMCIILILIFFLDGKVKLYESIILLLGYGLYVLCMAFNERIFNWLDRMAGKKIMPEESGDHKLSDLAAAMAQQQSPRGEEFTKNEAANGAENGDAKEGKEELKEGAEEGEKEEEEEEEQDLFKWPSDGSPLDKFIWIFAISYYWMFWLTIPDCRLDHRKSWYLGTFTMSVLWIGVLVYFMVWATNIIGCIINFPPVPMAVLVLAAGTSIPDMFGSLAVAREGQGDMAVSNAIGSNVFDILLGLGLPWFIMILWRDEDIEVEKGDLFMNIGFLFAVLIAYLVAVFWNRCKLTARMGSLLVALYGCFVIFTIVYYLIVDACGDSDSDTLAPTASPTIAPTTAPTATP